MEGYDLAAGPVRMISCVNHFDFTKQHVIGLYGKLPDGDISENRHFLASTYYF